MRERRGDWRALYVRLEGASAAAGELSALSADELEPLHAYVRRCGFPRIAHLSLHAPAKDARDERRIAATLERILCLPGAPRRVIVHPDTICDPGLWEPLGAALVIENLNPRAFGYQGPEDLGWMFARLPRAGLCLDLAHASAVDPSMGIAHAILAAHGPRLAQLHLSGADEQGHHRALTRDDLTRYAPVLARCAHVPWIIEALGEDGAWVEVEARIGD